MASDSSKDSLANVPRVSPDTCVQEPSSESVAEVVVASDSSEDS